MIYQNYFHWSLSLFHRFLTFFSSKTENNSAQLSCKSCQRKAILVGCLALTFRLSPSHTSLIGFKFADCADQDISWRISCSSLHLMYVWLSLQVCFGSLSCMTTNSWPTSSIPDGIVWCYGMLWLLIWFYQPYFWSFLSCFLMSPYSIIHCSSENF